MMDNRPSCFAVVRQLFQKFQQFQLLFWRFFRLFRCGQGSCFRNFSGFSYFFGDFSGCFAEFRELFWGFQHFQLLFSRIFPAFGLDWGAVLDVLWITATQGLPAINLWLLYTMLIQCGEYYAKEKMMVHTGFVERVLAQNKKRFQGKQIIRLHAAVNLCLMDFLSKY